MSGARLGLLRHFPTDWNREGRLQGRVDRPLTPEARAALAGLAPPPGWEGARVIASPLSRAQDTAAALWPAFETDARLTELAWGAWEGRRGAELLADPASGYAHVEAWGWERRPPGGESPGDARARVAPLLAEIAREGCAQDGPAGGAQGGAAGWASDGRPTLLVAHRGLIRVILAQAWRWDFDRPEPFRIRRGCIHTLRLDAAGAPCDPGGDVALARRATPAGS
ncbi:histidine phosphatase family protein [Rubrimonas cliftonensis]|uniref:Probable phosphoglycerate mutase n=1 Tax=Rubrimonas cliftonensis TaxID=89524 RepID=A0A1H4D5E8_9RHOB|nr:histidine phosphatase family protein [Rubrimonas cliftonensis]SEA67821.1 probable phosphoglycerate mutase [Rubrimonas cliftonensis]